MNNKIMYSIKHTFICSVTAYMLLTTNLFANPLVFQQAEKLYNEKQYEKALELYKTLENTNNHSATLYYNIGNCYYRLQHFTQAIWYYEKALKLKPYDEDIKNNLQLANQKTKDNIPVYDHFSFNNWLVSFSSFFSSNTWAWLSFILFLLFWISLSMFFYAEKILIKRTSLNLIFIFLSLTIIFWYFSYAKYKNITQNTHAIIFQQVVNIKTEPNEKSNTAFILHEGTKVKLDTKKDNWYKIRIHDNKTGWIQSEYLREI